MDTTPHSPNPPRLPSLRSLARTSIHCRPVLAVAVALLAFLARPASSQDPSAAADTADAAASFVEPVASVEGISEYRLDNGLRVLLFPDPSQPRITVNITYLVGSRHEGYGETGMAHLLEHLLFQGTPDHPDIPQELSEHGARPNGTTWYDRTNYYETFPASDENLEWALDLEADRMVNSYVSADDLASEMTVVRNEMESGENSPFNILRQRILSSAYLWHNYGQATIGARSDVENVPIERLQAFYRKYYQPDNAVLVVAGRFETDRALELIREKFGEIPRPERTGEMRLWPTYTDEPTQDGQREVTLRRVGDEQIAMVMYHVPPGSHEDFAAVDLLSHVLGDTPSGRLHRSLVEPGLAARASAAEWQLAEAGPFFAWAVVRPEEDLEEAWGALDGTLEAATGEDPITDEEVERARTDRLNDMQDLFDDTEGIALALSEWAAMGDWRLFFLHRDRIEAVTTDEVNRVARTYLVDSNRTVGRFVPTEDPVRAEIPEPPNVDSLVADYRGRDVAGAGESFDPSPENVDDRTTVVTLDNGLQVALLPKSTRGNAVRGRLRLHFGDEESLWGRSTAGELTADMLLRGTEELGRQELADSLDRMRSELSLGGGPSLTTGSMRTVGENLPELLRLLGDVLRRPGFDPGEFEILKEQRMAALEAQRSDPGARAQRALQRHMNPLPEGHPEYTETLDEAIQKLRDTTLDDVRGFHRDFYGPQSGTLVLVGDFDPERVRPALEEALGDWESPHPYTRVATDAAEVPAEEIVIETPDRANAFFFAQQNLALSDDDPAYPALALAGYMLGGGVLNSRLTRRIRQEEGISYSVGANISGHPIDEDGAFLAYAIHAPENTRAVEDAFRDEMQTVLEEGFRADELEAAREGYLESRRLARSDDAELAGTLANRLYFDRTLAWDAAFEDRIRELTLEEVNAAVREHLDLDRISVVRAGDFSDGQETADGTGDNGDDSSGG